MMVKAKLLVRVGDVPEGSWVTKRTGNKRYRVRALIRVRNSSESDPVIRAGEGVKFLVADDGDAWSVPDTTEVVWEADADVLSTYLNGLYEEDK